METGKKRCTAIVLAAGSGRRMESAVPKQFMLLQDQPVLWYSLKAVEESGIIDDCILVAGEGDTDYVRREIVDRYGFRKVTAVTAGGRERWESVYRGLCVIAERNGTGQDKDGYIFIHDGARPFLTEEILRDTYKEVCRHGACVTAVPVKDTIKVADENGFAVQTPDRRLLWAVQTPQVFEAGLIISAYQKLFEAYGKGDMPAVTDDAMVAEKMLGIRVKLVKGTYGNIKITTPEDIGTAVHLCGHFLEKSKKSC